MITSLQIIGIVFTLGMMYFTFLYYKKNIYSKSSFILWLLVWSGAVSLITFPVTVYGIMETLKIDRTADFIVMVGFVFFGIIVFYQHTIISEHKKKMEKLIREIAIKFPENKK